MGNRPVYGIYTSMEATSLREWELHASPCILSIQWAIHCPFEGPHWLAKGAAFSAYTPRTPQQPHHRPRCTIPLPSTTAICDPTPTTHPDHHSPHPKPSPTQSSTITPPNPRPPLHPIPDHHPSAFHDKSLTISETLIGKFPFLRGAKACDQVVLKQ